MSRSLLAGALLLASSAAATSDDVAGPDPSGIWMRGDGNARVRVSRCGTNLCGINLWIKDTSRGEAVGDRLVMTMKPKGRNGLIGQGFDVKRNMTYSIEATVEKASMSTRGCILGGLICKSVIWWRSC